MKIYFRFFYHMLNSRKRKKNTVLSSFIANFTAENAPIYHMILHLWSEISLFHKLIYDIAPGSILIDREVVVRL